MDTSIREVAVAADAYRVAHLKLVVGAHVRGAASYVLLRAITTVAEKGASIPEPIFAGRTRAAPQPVVSHFESRLTAMIIVELEYCRV